MACTPSREALLALIQPDMRLTKEFLKRIYAFNMECPGFSEQAIAVLESAGCSKARVYYENWVAEYQAAHDKEMKEVARWYRKECEKEFEKMKKGRESNGNTVGDWHRFKGFPSI